MNKASSTPSGDDTPDGWSSSDKFDAVLQTVTMNDAEIAAFCRAQGLYPEQIQRWKSACQNANDWDQKNPQNSQKANDKTVLNSKKSKPNSGEKKKPSPKPPLSSSCKKSSTRCSRTRKSKHSRTTQTPPFPRQRSHPKRSPTQPLCRDHRPQFPHPQTLAKRPLQPQNRRLRSLRRRERREFRHSLKTRSSQRKHRHPEHSARPPWRQWQPPQSGHRPWSHAPT